MSREDTLREGVRILDPALRSAGFGFEPVYDGHYRCVRYVRRKRVLELHFSDSLRLVSQRIGELVVMHDDFMRALLGPNGGHYPPGASDDPLDAFQCLRMDLEHHCRDFLRGRGHDWREVAERALLDPRRFTVTHEFLQLEDTRRDARSAFAARQFAKVVALYSAIGDQLMPAERRRLEIAGERVRTGRLDGATPATSVNSGVDAPRDAWPRVLQTAAAGTQLHSTPASAGLTSTTPPAPGRSPSAAPRRCPRRS